MLVVGDLVKIPEQTLHHLLGASNGRRLAALARDDDVRLVEPLRVAKSVGHEETFSADLRNRQDLHRHVVRMADAVGSRLQEAGLRGRTITLKVRYADHTTFSRSQTLPTPTDSAHALAAVAEALLGAVDVAPGVRLLGVSMSSLGSRGAVGHQLSLSDEDDRRPDTGDRLGGIDGRETEAGGVRQAAWEEVEAAVLQVRVRYGQSAVSPAALLGSGGDLR